ncbi:MAG: hypothetical protein ACJAVK_001701 [Akkermansiaceae bacterium]
MTPPIHAIWANEWFTPMLNAGVSHTEMHIYARGGHGGPKRGPDEIPYASWPERFTEWLSDLGFLGPLGEPTRAEKKNNM